VRKTHKVCFVFSVCLPFIHLLRQRLFLLFLSLYVS
jgi:hypothetical protein